MGQVGELDVHDARARSLEGSQRLVETRERFRLDAALDEAAGHAQAKARDAARQKAREIGDGREERIDSRLDAIVQPIAELWLFCVVARSEAARLTLIPELG